MVLSSCCCWFFFSQACIYRDSVFNELADNCVKWAAEFLKPDKDKTGNNKVSLSVCLSVCFSLFLGLFLHIGFCTQNNVSVCLSGIDTSIKLKAFKFTAGGGGGGGGRRAGWSKLVMCVCVRARVRDGGRLGGGGVEEGRMEQVGYVCVRARVCVCVCVCARARQVENQVEHPCTWKTRFGRPSALLKRASSGRSAD